MHRELENPLFFFNVVLEGMKTRRGVKHPRMLGEELGFRPYKNADVPILPLRPSLCTCIKAATKCPGASLMTSRAEPVLSRSWHGNRPH